MNKMVNKIKEDKYRFFYPPEFEKVLDFLNKNGKFTALFMIHTGCRIMEARGFMKQPVFDNERNSITLLKTKVRAKLKERVPRSRTLGLNKSYYRELKNDFSTHRILSTNAFNIALRTACKKARIKNPEQFSSHNIRKTFATWMLCSGVDSNRLAKALGHTPTELFKDYTSNAPFNHNDKQIIRSLLGETPEIINQVL